MNIFILLASLLVAGLTQAQTAGSAPSPASASAAAAPTAAAAMLVGVPCGPAHTAKHDSTYNNGRQIKVRGQEFHHTEHTLSNWTDDLT